MLVAVGLASAVAMQPALVAAGPVVQLEAEARNQVAHDEMVVELATERRGDQPEALNQDVLRTVEAALARAKGIKGVKARVGNVSTQPEWNNQGQRTGWRVRGSLVLEGQDLKATGALAGELASTLQIASVQFRLTADARHREETRLLQQAADRFNHRALETAKAFGFSKFRIQSLTVNHAAGGPVRPVMAQSMMRAAGDTEMAKAAIPSDGGEAEVVLTISGTVELDR